MFQVPFLVRLLVFPAVVLILFGRVRRNRPVAIAGYVLLALAGLLVLLGYH